MMSSIESRFQPKFRIDMNDEIPQEYPISETGVAGASAADLARIDFMNKDAPSRQFPEGPLITVPATEDQILHMRHVSDQWDDKCVSFDDYMMIENKLGKMKYASQGQRYVLVPASDPEGLTIKSSTHLQDERAFLALPNQETRIIDAIYAGSLGTPLQFRKKGYATALIADVQKQISTKTPDETRLFFILSREDSLYKATCQMNSGICAKIAKGCDFGSNCTDISQKLDSNMDLAEKNNTASVICINESDLELYITADTALLKQECKALADAAEKPVVCLLPSVQCLQQRSSRSSLRFQYAFQSDRQMDPKWLQCGASIGEPGHKDWGYILWRTSTENTPNVQKELKIARLRYSSISQLKSLLQSALDVADNWGMSRGLCWNTVVSNTDALNKLQIPFTDNYGHCFAAFTNLSMNGSQINLPHILLTDERYYTFQ